MNKNDAVAILSRLEEKGILGETALKEINNDIFDLLKENMNEGNDIRVQEEV